MVGRLSTVVLAALFAVAMFAAPTSAHSYGKSWDGHPNGEGSFGANIRTSQGTVSPWADDTQRDGHCVAVVAGGAQYFEQKWSCGDRRSVTWDINWNVDMCVTGHHFVVNQCDDLWN